MSTTLATSVPSTNIAVSARDGLKLAGTLYQPEQPNGIVLLISSAATVPRRYYDKFASFLCAEGFVVCTYDFRGVGDSSVRNWIGRPPTFRSWGEEDLAGAIDTLSTKFPGTTLMCIGHSMGGSLLGLAANNHLVAAQVAVASQSSYWRNADEARSKRLLWLLSSLVFPVVTRLCGYFPGRSFGLGNWPKGVALEWARWSRNPDFIVDDRGRPLRRHFDQYQGKMRFYVIADDPFFAPPRAVAHIASFYRQADVEVVTRRPADYGVRAIGHFGFFHSLMPKAAWHEIAQWLRDQLYGRLRGSRGFNDQ
jgi:predicted alpha/beta hydrolase